jgi:hypothetical protein
MKTINRKLFFDSYPFRPLSESQVVSLNFLLDKFDHSVDITRLSEYAYIFATLKLETADTFAPVAEAYWVKPESKRIAVLTKMYAGRGTIIRNGKAYWYGRGYVQNTHDYNYENLNKHTKPKGYDIVVDPELALNPEAAWIILEAGMSKGIFTGKKLSDYFNDEHHDFYHARKIINGMDRASLVQSYAEKFFDVLEFADSCGEPGTGTAHKAINLIPLNVAEAQAEAISTDWQLAYKQAEENTA